MKKYLVIITFLLLNDIYAERYIRAEIYYYNYGYDLRAGMSASELRERYLSKLIINDSELIKKLLENIPVGRLKPFQYNLTSKDIRLVFDFYNADNVLTSYHADRFYFYDSTGRNATKLIDSFVENFRMGIYFN